MSKENRIWVVTICENWSPTRAFVHLGTIKVVASVAKEAAGKALIVAKEQWSGDLVVNSIVCYPEEDISLEVAESILEAHHTAKRLQVEAEVLKRRVGVPSESPLNPKTLHEVYPQPTLKQLDGANQD